MAKAWALLFALSLLLSYGAVKVVLFLVTPASRSEIPRVIEIETGMPFRATASLLAREKVIAHPFFFGLLARWMKVDRKLQAGEFAFHTAMLPTEVLQVLVRGKPVEHTVTIPEGLTARQIGLLLQEAGWGEAALFETLLEDPTLLQETGGEGLEGYLFPATYAFAKGTMPDVILSRMVTQFHSVYDDAFRRRAEALGMTRREVVTLASMIEKETAQTSERGLVSAVFHNRLKKGMRLQSDPTVIFGIPNFNGNLTKADLETPTPYNTYLINGLPPGPIANPGREALHAALYPAQTDYLFFVATGDGMHVFSRTLADHNGAVLVHQARPRPVE